MSLFRCARARLVGAMLLLPIHPAIAADILDRQLDGDGARLLDLLLPQDGSTSDQPIVSCPAADDKQLVVVRKGANAIVSTRLRFDGSIDTSFGNGGARVVPLATTSLSSPVTAAVCRADGSIWIAASAHMGDGEQNVRLFAVGPDGLFVSGFVGVAGGVGDVNLDSIRADLLKDERPLGMNQTPAGGALITGYATTTVGKRPFLVTLGADARLKTITFPMPDGLHGDVVATAAGVGPGGGIWVAGHGARNGFGVTAFRVYVDPVSMQVLRTELYSLGTDSIRTAGGGVIRDGVMVVGATRRNGTAPAQPLLLVMRDDGLITSLGLPVAPPLAAGLSTGLNAEGTTVLPVPGGRVLYAIGAEAFEETTFRGYKGWYFARAYIGGSAAEDRVDPGFGDAGRAVVSVASGDASCGGKLNTQLHTRIGHWLGRPTVVGNIRRGCDPDVETDGVVLRLKGTDAMFDDGFE